jgi:TfoX/Sxy family transcriptional regulator of competence genes
MLRCVRITLGLTVILTMSAGNAHAQWGYGWGAGGGYGGGWSSTLQGDVARGMGAYNAGTGIYNRDTAIARSINSDTYMRMNQYFYESHLEATRQYWAKNYADQAKAKNAYDQHQERLEKNPTTLDVENGNALNRALDQLTDPRLGSSTIRMANGQVDSDLIREIPFRNNTEAVTIVLSEVKTATKWPTALYEPRFAPDKKKFEEVVDQARKEDEQGDISPETIQKARSLIASLRSKLDAAPIDDPTENKAALNFVKTLGGLIHLLEMPDTKQALDELRKVKTTSLGNLLGFMHAFNLRFGPATTPRQKIVYNKLYPLLDDTRDHVISEAKLDGSSNGKANVGHVGDVFSKMSMDEIEGKAKKDTPAPPNPQQ